MARFTTLPATVLGRYSKAVLSARGIAEAQAIMRDLQSTIAQGRVESKNLLAVGQAAVEGAKARTPVLTGRLLSRNALRQINPFSIVIYNDAPYAKWVHDGTSRMEARPFLLEPVMEARAAFPALWVKDYKQFYSELLRKHPPH